MNKKEVKKLIAKAIENNPLLDQIKKISLFGSYLSNRPRADSDIDLLIEFNPDAHIGFFKLISIQNSIEEKVGKKIDLLTPEALSKYFREKVLKEAEIIYEG